MGILFCSSTSIFYMLDTDLHTALPISDSSAAPGPHEVCSGNQLSSCIMPC